MTKTFGDFTAVHDITLDIEEGEFFALLGPSGCGKTTTMRCIAGFENPSSGSIYIGDREVEKIPANRRNCGMVFQS
ncbi:ATP-binding cassette domain-containing protein, partial [Escherichia coli]|uniref:ATP-binding cassette domain-containing protein n=1 Tax=Escherichia coli TaxID=562 RepID=UPI001CCCB66C